MIPRFEAYSVAMDTWRQKLKTSSSRIGVVERWPIIEKQYRKESSNYFDEVVQIGSFQIDLIIYMFIHEKLSMVCAETTFSE